MQPMASSGVPSLAKLIRAGGVFYDIEATVKRDVLRAFVARLPLSPVEDRGVLLRALEAREAKGSTGIGNGIAIPHIRDHTILPVAQPFVTLGLLQRPVDFDAMDRRPVHALFMVVSPDVSIHLRILGQLGFLLRDASLAEMLRTRAPAEALIARIEFLESSRQA
jgi:PTS system nitrogen regulatory IIA component